MEVAYELMLEDYWQYNMYYRSYKQNLRPAFQNVFFGLIVAMGLVGIAAAADTWSKTGQPPWTLVLSMIATCWFALKLFPLTKARAYKVGAKNPGLFGMHTVVIDPQWVTEKSLLSENKRAWSTVLSIDQNQDYIFLFLAKAVAHIVPKRAFSGPQEAELFLNTARDYWEAAKQNQRYLSQEVEGAWPPAPRPKA